MKSLQKRLAARVLKIGETRVWMNPEKMKDIEKAITKIDIRKLIKKNDIRELPEKVRVKLVLKSRKRGQGKRKGKKNAIVPSKTKWINTVRPQRRVIKEFKDGGHLDNRNYRKLYKLIKGGMFRSRSHLKLYIEQNKMLK